MVWLCRWIGFLMTVFRSALIGAAGASGGGGGASELTGIASTSSFNTYSGNWQVGWRFYPNEDIEVTALRFYDDGGRTETLRLWRLNDQSELASVSVTAGTNAYGEASITPVTLTKNHAYTVAHYDGGTTRTIAYPDGRTIDTNLSFMAGRLGTSAGYPGSANGTIVSGADIKFTVEASTPPGGTTDVAPSGTFSNTGFGTNMYTSFTPSSDVWIDGAKDATQPSGQTLALYIWEPGRNDAPMVTTSGVTDSGGTYTASFSSAVKLLSGLTYYIGWVRESGSTSLVASNSALSWTGYTAGSTIRYASTPGNWPNQTLSNYWTQFTLVEAT